jgi:DNA-binding response OmpR family regulator
MACDGAKAIRDDYGIQHYLVKPFLMRELLGALAAVYPAQYHR